MSKEIVNSIQTVTDGIILDNGFKRFEILELNSLKMSKRYGYFFHGHNPDKGQYIEINGDNLDIVFSSLDNDFEFCALYVLKDEMYEEIRSKDEVITIAAVTDKNDNFIFTYNFITNGIEDGLGAISHISSDIMNPMKLPDCQIWLSENYGNSLKIEMITSDSTPTHFELSVDEQANHGLSVSNPNLIEATVQLCEELKYS